MEDKPTARLLTVSVELPGGKGRGISICRQDSCSRSGRKQNSDNQASKAGRRRGRKAAASS